MDCRSQPCENGGTCVELGNTTICQCSSGFTGSICQGSECVNLFHPIPEEWTYFYVRPWDLITGFSDNGTSINTKPCFFTVYIIMYTNQIIDLKGQLNSMALQGTQARPPSHVKLYRALRDSKRVRYVYLMISKDIWRLPSLCNDNTFVRRDTVELEKSFQTVTSFLLTCVRKVWSVPIYLWIRIIKRKTEFLLVWNSFWKHQSNEQLLIRLLWILLKFLRSEDDYVPSHIRLFCSSS